MMRELLYQQALNSHKTSERLSSMDKLQIIDMLVVLPEEMIAEAYPQGENEHGTR